MHNTQTESGKKSEKMRHRERERARSSDLFLCVYVWNVEPQFSELRVENRAMRVTEYV